MTITKYIKKYKNKGIYFSIFGSLYQIVFQFATSLKTYYMVFYFLPFLFCSDLYGNKIQIWRHNFTVLPKGLRKM